MQTRMMEMSRWFRRQKYRCGGCWRRFGVGKLEFSSDISGRFRLGCELVWRSSRILITPGKSLHPSLDYSSSLREHGISDNRYLGFRNPIRVIESFHSTTEDFTPTPFGAKLQREKGWLEMSECYAVGCALGQSYRGIGTRAWA